MEHLWSVTVLVEESAAVSDPFKSRQFPGIPKQVYTRVSTGARGRKGQGAVKTQDLDQILVLFIL